MVDKWEAVVTNPKVKYYVGLSGGNAYNPTGHHQRLGGDRSRKVRVD
jgi:hypothetical protein